MFNSVTYAKADVVRLKMRKFRLRQTVFQLKTGDHAATTTASKLRERERDVGIRKVGWAMWFWATYRWRERLH